MESTLALDRTALKLVVGIHAGFGPDSTLWDVNQLSRIVTAVNDGVSWVYFPGNYEWSFLKPVAEVTLASGATTVPLPADLNWLQGRVIPASAAGEAQFAIQVVDDQKILERQALSSTSTGRPMMAAVQALRGTDASHSGLSQLLVYPIADQAYTFQIKYSLLPDATTDQNSHVYGGAQHAQTFKAAVKAAYSAVYDGPELVQMTMAEFQRTLLISIEQDRKRKPTLPGVSIDLSDWEYGRQVRVFSPAAVNGTVAGIA